MLRSGPVSMWDSEPAIMSEFSSDTDPYMEDELCRFQPLQAAVSPLSTTTEMGVMTSPSHYPAPAVPVVPSAVSSVWVSPAPVREVSSTRTLDVFPTYEPSPDTSLVAGDSCTLGGSCAALGNRLSLAGGFGVFG